jgi:L,D-transpeptidase catalytic domain
MADGLSSSSEPSAESRRSRRLVAIAAGALILVLVVGFFTAALAMSGATLEPDSEALAGLDAQPFGGSIQSVHAVGPHGEPIPLKVSGEKLIPRRKLRPGEAVSVDVVVKRPGFVAWVAGSEHSEHLALRAPVARVESPWLTVPRGSAPRISFSRPVGAVAYGPAGHLSRRNFAAPRKELELDSEQPAGAVLVATAPRSWERLGRPQSVTWFPAGGAAAVAASPEPGSEISPATPLRLTFSRPVSQVLGSSLPRLSPATTGRWRRAGSHTLVFHPTGYGAGLSTDVEARLPKRVEVIEDGESSHESSGIDWHIPPGSTLRLQQLLAEAGYLPLSWEPDRARVAKTPSAQLRAAVHPPRGHFKWRYGNLPSGLREAWSAGRLNKATEGAVMAFESAHELEIDGEAGSEVWDALLRSAIAGRRDPEPGYSYVHVSETIPETVTLWHDGRTVTTVPANTGIPGAETELGTFPVFEHLEETTMSGENPDGSHYEDPGIMWVSYFNGGDALHAFDRASFGTPQSLGCVEMELSDAARIWPYTPIGTLVTVES